MFALFRIEWLALAGAGGTQAPKKPE